MQLRLAQYDWSFKMRSWKYTRLLLGFARRAARNTACRPSGKRHGRALRPRCQMEIPSSRGDTRLASRGSRPPFPPLARDPYPGRSRAHRLGPRWGAGAASSGLPLRFVRSLPQHRPDLLEEAAGLQPVTEVVLDERTERVARLAPDGRRERLPGRDPRARPARGPPTGARSTTART